METANLAPAREVLAEILMEATDAVCEVCGNRYDKCFVVQINGEAHVFDSFECAIHAVAPKCAHCGCNIVGHGMEADGIFYCCAHCASHDGIHDFEDRIVSERSSL